LTGLPDEVFQTRLAGALDDCLTYLRLDPRKEPIPVAPGAHYFMGGIQVDERHKTIMPNLYAAGECCRQYHGANRLGGNSLLGAVFGGTTAADSALADGFPAKGGKLFYAGDEQNARHRRIMQDAVRKALGVARDQAGLEAGIAALLELPGDMPLLARAIMTGALERRESRGAHFRTDHPETNDTEFRKTTVVALDGGRITARFEDIPERR
jgi:succinate dehydrogenase / fumarate reductase flavoprotein subunit